MSEPIEQPSYWIIVGSTDNFARTNIKRNAVQDFAVVAKIDVI